MRNILLSTFAILSLGIPSFAQKPLSPQEQLKTFTLPAGFTIELIASEKNGLVNPIDLAFDDQGRLWTQTARMYPLDTSGHTVKNGKSGNATTKEAVDYYTLKKKGTDQILLIDDPTQPVSGRIPVFYDGLALPQSILPYKDGVFVAHGSEMLFLTDSNEDGKAEKHATVLSGFGVKDTHTMSHTLVRGPGGWVHFTHGALNSGKVETIASGKKTLIKYSKTLRFSLDGQRFEVTGGGHNNIWGFHLKENGQWYGTEANDKGWALAPLHPMMMYPGIGRDKIRNYQPFPGTFHDFRVGGTGISGLTYDENGSKGFPERWDNVGFLANPMTHTINCVVADREADGSVVSQHLDDFLTCSDPWFRPVNIEFGPDGSLYVVDWYNKVVSHNEVARDHPDRDKKHGRLWRIRHKSQTSSLVPNLVKASNKSLLEHLASDIQWEKRAAWHQIADRQATELAPDLQKIVLNKSQTLSTRIVALWALESLRTFDEATLSALTKDSDPDLRREAVRSLIHFSPGIEEIMTLISPLMEDPHYMVREQVLRTLAEVNEANQDSIKLLVSACVPASTNNDWNEGYKINFQRFLARKALENYQSELALFLNSAEGQELPAANRSWANEALDEKNRANNFLANWKAGKKTLDADTLVSVASQLNRPAIFNALKPEFAKKEFLTLATEVQPRLKSSQLHPALTIGIHKALRSRKTEDHDLALQVAIQYQVPSVTEEIQKLAKEMRTAKITPRIINALAISPKQNSRYLASLGRNPQLAQSLRLQALSKLYPLSPRETLKELIAIISPLGESEKKAIASSLAQTQQGASILLALFHSKVLLPHQLDLEDARRVLALSPRKAPARSRLQSVIAAQSKAASQAAESRLSQYEKALKSLTGNPEIGEGIFSSCLSCHAVGNQGYDIAPALDGSASRDVHHLLTAIVKPDAAVETGYQLYRIVKKNGEVLEGYRDQTNSFGTTLAYMGNGKVFTAKEHIKTEGPVEGRSFMPNYFGNYSEQMMIDLVTYIQKLK